MYGSPAKGTVIAEDGYHSFSRRKCSFPSIPSIKDPFQGLIKLAFKLSWKLSTECLKSTIQVGDKTSNRSLIQRWGIWLTKKDADLGLKVPHSWCVAVA